MSEALTAPTAPVGPVDDPMVPNPYEVVGRREEGADTVTLTLAPTGPALPAARPGQFFMLWAPGVGEVPISLGGSGPDGTIDETIRVVGAVSRKLAGTSVGGTIGVRGPFGTAWDLDAAAGRHVLFDKQRPIEQQRRLAAIPQHLDEGDKKIVNAVAELLNIGVLIGRAFVAIDGNALVNRAPVAVVLFAERLHDELLQVARNQLEPIFVGQYHQIATADSVGGFVPADRHQHRRIVRRLGVASGIVHRFGTAYQLIDRQSL